MFISMRLKSLPKVIARLGLGFAFAHKNRKLVQVQRTADLGPFLVAEG